MSFTWDQQLVHGSTRIQHRKTGRTGVVTDTKMKNLRYTSVRIKWDDTKMEQWLPKKDIRKL